MSTADVTGTELTRREFLNYAWLASLGFIFAGGFGSATYFFAFPRFKPGTFGGTFTLKPEDIAAPGDPPKPYNEGLFWLVHLAETDDGGKPGLLALYKVCVHLGCLYKWEASTNRFECPCHGSWYLKDGTYIQGPAPRSLDRMVIRFISAEGEDLAVTNERGAPLIMPEGTDTIAVETGKIIQGESHA